MVLYHGSSCRNIDLFQLDYARSNTDFGKGIYFTTNFKQALMWSCQYTDIGAVYECDVDFSSFIVLEHFSKQEDLCYILYLCRIDLEEIAAETIDGFYNADLISGRMLKEPRKFQQYAEQFNCGDIDYETYKKEIKLFNSTYNQYCFKTQNAVNEINNSMRKKYLTTKCNGHAIVEAEIDISIK